MLSLIQYYGKVKLENKRNTYEFVLSALLWSALVTDHDDKLVLVLCSSTAHVVVAGFIILTATIAVAQVHFSISNTFVLIFVFLEVANSATTFWLGYLVENNIYFYIVKSY